VRPTISAERRVSGLSDRRLLRRGGRRHGDHDGGPWEFDLRVMCEACGKGWASIISFTSRGQLRLRFACLKCGHLEYPLSVRDLRHERVHALVEQRSR
jgi:hypothetical protein